MITPIKAIANRTTVSNPFALNPQRVYKQSNFTHGEKLDINCNEVRTLSTNGHKLDILA